jgi:hypothetical protein
MVRAPLSASSIREHRCVSFNLSTCERVKVHLIGNLEARSVCIDSSTPANRCGIFAATSTPSL